MIFNVFLIVWMASYHFHGSANPQLGGVASLSSVQLLICGAGIAVLLRQHLPQARARQALAPAAAPPAVAEAGGASRQRYAFDHASDGLAILGAGGELLETNLRLRDMAGRDETARPPGHLEELILAEDRLACRRNLERLVAEGGPVEFQARLDRRDGGRIWTRIILSLCPADGDLPRTILAEVRDVTERQQRLGVEKAFLDLALAAGRLGTWQIDTRRKLVLGSDKFWSILGLPPASTRSLDALSAVVHPADWSRFVAYGAGDASGDRQLEFRVRRADGHIRWVALRACEPSPGGAMRTGIASDVTYRRERIRLRAAARRRKGAVLELRHRLCNLFPAVIALVKLMEAPEDDVPGYKQSLIARIRALEATHQLLSRHGTWAAPLRDIVVQELKPYQRLNNFTISGPPISMSDGAAEGFVMIVHELATNAVKYGALGHANGHVDVKWWFDESPEFAGDLHFEWVETGRRPGIVNRNRRGFGSNILGIRGTPLVGRSASMELLNGGLRYSLHLSRNDVASSPTFASARSSA